MPIKFQTSHIFIGLLLVLAGVGVFCFWSNLTSDVDTHSSSVRSSRKSRALRSGVRQGIDVGGVSKKSSFLSQSGQRNANVFHSHPDDVAPKVYQRVKRTSLTDAGIMESSDGLDSEISSESQDSNFPSFGLIKALGADQSLTARQRVLLIEQMNGSVNEDERQAAYKFLSSQEPPEGMAKSQWRWMVDELITLLRDDAFDNTGLGC